MTVLGHNSPIRVSTGIARGQPLDSPMLKHIQQKEFKLLINRMQNNNI